MNLENGLQAEDVAVETNTPVRRVIRYARALSRWIKAGRPERSREEIETIFSEHCIQCTEYDERPGRCKFCGCNVGLRAAPMLNKIAMATENCPLDKW